MLKMGKARATEAIGLIQAALLRRGLKDVKVMSAADPNLPSTPSPNVVPYLHYGAIGLNALEDYDAAVFVHGYYIPDEVLTKAVFPHLPPSKRPKARITAIGGRRRITWTGAISDEDRKLAEAMLFRLEADPALQAFGRVRFAIKPRTVVMSIQHNIQPRLGRVKTVTNLATARVELGLDGTADERHRHQIERLRALLAKGMTLEAASKDLGISYRSAMRLAAEAGIQLNKGRSGGVYPTVSAEKVTE
jgi:hypothetical protein